MMGSAPVFFDGGADLLRVLLTVPLLYLALIVFIRLAGKRSTSQMNTFDWVVTVSIGGMLSSTILLDDVVIGEALLGVGLLLGLQWVVTWCTARSPLARTLVKATPTLLYAGGAFQHAAMRRERITESEVRSAIRVAGISDLSRVGAVVLETDARLSVLTVSRDAEPAQLDVMEGVRTGAAGR